MVSVQEDDDGLMRFATADDVAAGWRPLDDSERAKAEELIVRASDLICTYPGWVRATPVTLKRICCSVVRRAMEADMNGSPAGASQYGTTAGPFSENVSYANPSGDLRLWPSEEAQLRPRGMVFGTIDMSNGEYTTLGRSYIGGDDAD